ncbi:hypothetical protein FGO68_gene16575 [Halteria grandinella]|uniref:Uncharacterized protein n=1 Tax=Halteria grandinella TaxID=5974 RepID=A0A8J8NIN2_HALGN|nr:hypothetical protein FGO68_gene16575 [Halteria grandinella]
MEQLKARFDAKEREQRETYEEFYQKNKENEFLNDLTIIKFRFYHYKEFAKIFANNMHSEQFEGTRHSLYSTVFLPTLVALGFNLFNPFSIFRRILIVSSALGSSASWVLNLKEELGDIAKDDAGQLGEIVRYRFQQLALFDGLVRSYSEESRKMREKKG